MAQKKKVRQKTTETLATGQTKANVRILMKKPAVKKHFIGIDKIVKKATTKTAEP